MDEKGKAEDGWRREENGGLKYLGMIAFGWMIRMIRFVNGMIGWIEREATPVKQMQSLRVYSISSTSLRVSTTSFIRFGGMVPTNWSFFVFGS